MLSVHNIKVTFGDPLVFSSTTILEIINIFFKKVLIDFTFVIIFR